MTGVIQESKSKRSEQDLELQLLTLIPLQEKRGPISKFTPWQLAVRVGERAGAVGVKTLQLAGQWFHVPPKDRANQLRMYDRVRAASRLTDYRTLMREAERVPAVAEFVENIAEIRPRIGGGSLFSVDEIVMKDGRREAVAIQNPNALYHARLTVNFLRKVAAALQQQEPDNLDFALMGSLLDDVEAWIDAEVNEPDYQAKDQQFREQNDYRFGQFPDDPKNGYKILVPKLYPTHSRRVRREEFIEGRNLTELRVVGEKTDIPAGVISQEDFKRVVSRLVVNFHYQLLKTGLVHSDYHPGNFRITPDNQYIAVFDRRNLLKLTAQDQGFMKKILRSMVMGQAKAQEVFLDYVLSLDENENLRPNREGLLKELNAATKGVPESEESLIQTVVRAKQLGLKLPLRMSLTFKNLLALNRLASEAGFTNLVDAYTHGSDRISDHLLSWVARR